MRRFARQEIQRLDAIAAIERAQSEHGALLSDVSYVVENHALFDARFEPLGMRTARS